MFEWLRESTWGYPIIGAIHVLGMGWFAGIVLDAADPRLKRIGLSLMFTSGLLLFALHPGRYYGSAAFRIKMVLLLLLCVPAKPGRSATLAIWIAIVFASRGIAFF